MKGTCQHILVLGCILAACSSASAQVLGTFRWQFAPYCNVVTVLVEQKGSVYELTGTEDGCNGAAPAATANGSAHLNAGGTVGFSLAMVRPDSMVINAMVSLNITTLNGTWTDDWGNSGTFVFNPPLPVSAPARRLTMRGEWSVIFPAASASSEGTSSISFPRQLPSAPSAVATNVIPVGGPPTANCPGSVADPQAAPGHVCLYERVRSNADSVRLWSAVTGQYEQASTVGFGIISNATAAGNVYTYGRWAVSVP